MDMEVTRQQTIHKFQIKNMSKESILNKWEQFKRNLLETEISLKPLYIAEHTWGLNG